MTEATMTQTDIEEYHTRLRRYAEALLDIGVPVIYCKANTGWTPDPDSKEREFYQPTGWSRLSVEDVDREKLLSEDLNKGVYAFVTGHGVDVLDIDAKGGGHPDHLPKGIRTYGVRRTPSGGWHFLVRSTGYAKIGEWKSNDGFLGDYLGGTEDGGGRALCYMGGHRPLYPDGMYRTEDYIDLDMLIEDGPDDMLITLLQNTKGTKKGEGGRPRASYEACNRFLAAISEIPEKPCPYGRSTLAGLMGEAPLSTDLGHRHKWIIRVAPRFVEMANAGCFHAADWGTICDLWATIKPKEDPMEALSWGITNFKGESDCDIHNPKPVDEDDDAIAALRAAVGHGGGDDSGGGGGDGGDEPPEVLEIEITSPTATIRRMRRKLGLRSTQGLVRNAAGLMWIPSMASGDWDGISTTVHRIDTRHQFTSVLTSSALLFRVDSGRKIEVLPKADVLSAVMSIPALMTNVREISSVITVPVIDGSGRVADTPGFNGDGMVYLPFSAEMAALRIPENPTAAEIEAARDLILALIADFPFESADHRANYIAAMIAPALTRYVTCAFPAVIIEASTTGSGKTYLAQAISLLWDGSMAVNGADKMPQEELRKQVTAVLVNPAQRVVILDNMKGKIGGGVLEALVTSRTRYDRILGASTSVGLDNDRLWIFTSNNATVSEDMARRSLRVRLHPKVKDAYLRSGFAIPDFLGHVRENRAELVAALLTLIRAALSDGVRASGRADAYSSYVRVAQKVVDVAGINGTVMSEAMISESVTEETSDYEDLLNALQDEFGSDWFYAKEALRRAQDKALYDDPLSDAIRGIPTHKESGGWPSVKSFGRYLDNRRDKIVGANIQLVKGAKHKTNGIAWRVEKVTP